MGILQYLNSWGYLSWWSFGLIFILLEMFIPGTYLIWFGLSSFLMGILVSFYTFTPTQTGVLFALLSAVCAGFGWWVYAKIITKTQTKSYQYLNDLAGDKIGHVYNLTQDVTDGRSKAQVGDTVWLVQTQDGLKKGDKVKITGVKDGVILLAEKYTPKSE